MPKTTRRLISAVLVVSLVAVGSFLLDLLSNYASSAVPPVFQKYPQLVWVLIGTLIILIIVVNVIDQFSETKDSPSEKASKEETVSDSVNLPGDMLRKQDVFISYSHKDIKFVEDKLIPFLNQRSFTYCLDKEDFRTGSAIVEEMERCVRDSKRVILVLTKDYLDSEWARFENIMAQTLDPSARSRKLIPVLVKDCELPLRLRIYHYRDLRSDQRSQWDLLARDLS